MKRPKLEHVMEDYLKFLVTIFLPKCNNEKPVVLHSLRVSLKLYELGYDEDIVLGALLHDVVEDSTISLKEIENKFGTKISKIVDSLTEDKSIENKIKRNEELIDKSINYGKKSMIIKCADILDNSMYHYLVKEKSVSDRLFKKYNYFLDKAVLIKDEPIYQELLVQVKKLKEELNYE